MSLCEAVSQSHSVPSEVYPRLWDSGSGMVGPIWNYRTLIVFGLGNCSYISDVKKKRKKQIIFKHGRFDDHLRREHGVLERRKDSQNFIILQGSKAEKLFLPGKKAKQLPLCRKHHKLLYQGKISIDLINESYMIS